MNRKILFRVNKLKDTSITKLFFNERFKSESLLINSNKFSFNTQIKLKDVENNDESDLNDKNDDIISSKIKHYNFESLENEIKHSIYTTDQINTNKFDQLFNELLNLLKKNSLLEFERIFLKNKTLLLSNLKPNHFDVIVGENTNNPLLIEKIHDSIVNTEIYTQLSPVFLHFTVMALLEMKKTKKADYICVSNIIFGKKICFNTVASLLIEMNNEIIELEKSNGELLTDKTVNDENNNDIKDKTKDNKDRKDNKNKKDIKENKDNNINNKEKEEKDRTPQNNIKLNEYDTKEKVGRVNKKKNNLISETNEKINKLKKSKAFYLAYVEKEYSKDDVYLIKNIIDKSSQNLPHLFEEKQEESANIRIIQANNCGVQ